MVRYLKNVALGKNVMTVCNDSPWDCQAGMLRHAGLLGLPVIAFLQVLEGAS
jgi:hypothetical protein